MTKRYRVMIEGEDHSVWCEANNLTLEQAENIGPKYCEKYENAHWFIEIEESSIPMDYFSDEY